MPKLFISYRRQDSEHITGRIYDRLEDHFGRDAVFMDIDAIPFGVDFRQHLDEAVSQCDILLAVIGEQWLDCQGSSPGQRRLDDPADFVRIEIESALKRGIPVIPVLVGKAAMPAGPALPEGLKDLAFRNSAEVRAGRDFRDHVARLIRGIEHLTQRARRKAQQEQQPQQQTDETTIPPAQRIPPTKELPTGKIGDTISNDLGMRFAWVPPGKNWLGGGDGKPGTTKFTLAQGMWCGIYPVTQAEWEAVMGNNPAQFGGNPRYPVESVSWDDVQEFLKKLNARFSGSGLVYRLPTEQEWEYICRGGPGSQKQSAFHFYFARSKTDLTSIPTNALSSTQANFDGNYPVGSAAKGPYLQHPSEVGLYLPNPLGISDLHGNVWEWTSSQECSDRVVRGGGWINRGCAAADRIWFEPGFRNYVVGFRLLAVPSV